MNPSHRTASRFIAALAAAAFALPIGAQAPRLPRGGPGGKVEPPSTGPATEYLLTPSAHPGNAPTSSRATTKLSAFETETTGRNRQVLTIRTPLGSGREAVSTAYPAPANGLLRVEREPALGARSFRISARLLADGAAGLVGVALTDASLNHVLAGLVPDSRTAAPRIDLSRSTGEWTSIERGEPFSPRLSHWFRLELRVDPTAEGRRWALYAWQDGDPRPDKPTVTAIDQPGEGLLAELHASVWASGTGVRRIGDLLVQERPATKEATHAASLDVPPEDEWPIEVIADDVHYVLEDAPPDLTLPVDPDEPPPPDQGESIRTASASDTAHIATTTCDMYRDHWDGTAPSKPGSTASLRLPPRDNDCDGSFDEDPTDGSDNDGDGTVDEDSATGDAVLRWTSTDSKLGTRTLTDAPAVLLRIVLCWPSPREVVAFASAQSGTWLAGLAQSQPLGGGSAIVGSGLRTVSYDLTPAASTPLQVTILESGTAFSDGQLFDRAVTFTAQTSGGSGTVTTSATIDGAPYTLGNAYDAEGSHVLHVEASDGSGGSASAQAGFAIDLSPPQFQNLLPASGSLLPSGLVTVTGEVSADATSVTVAGQAATLGDPTGAWRPFSSAALVLPEGPSTLTLTATDGAGRTASAELLLAVDSLAPGVAILTPAPAADACLPAGQPLTFSGSLGEAHLGSLTLEVRTSDARRRQPRRHRLAGRAHLVRRRRRPRRRRRHPHRDPDRHRRSRSLKPRRALVAGRCRRADRRAAPRRRSLPGLRRRRHPAGRHRADPTGPPRRPDGRYRRWCARRAPGRRRDPRRAALRRRQLDHNRGRPPPGRLRHRLRRPRDCGPCTVPPRPHPADSGHHRARRRCDPGRGACVLYRHLRPGPRLRHRQRRRRHGRLRVLHARTLPLAGGREHRRDRARRPRRPPRQLHPHLHSALDSALGRDPRDRRRDRPRHAVHARGPARDPGQRPGRDPHRHPRRRTLRERHRDRRHRRLHARRHRHRRPRPHGECERRLLDRPLTRSHGRDHCSGRRRHPGHHLG